MVNTQTAFIAALTATTLLTGASAWAANQPTPDQNGMTPQQASVEKELGKVSVDGASAFQYVTLTRLAIFDGHIDAAKKYVNMAETALGKAKTDEAVFTKAEADLKPPAGKEAPAMNVTASAPAGDKQADRMKKAISWLPVDEMISINEDYTAVPAKKAAIADANKRLESGDRKGAMEKLKLADMDINITLAVLPLDQTVGDLHHAAGLINDGKYYEASQVLRQAQDRERFDVTSLSGFRAAPSSGSSNGPNADPKMAPPKSH
jgi:hypothetical protein